MPSCKTNGNGSSKAMAADTEGTVSWGALLEETKLLLARGGVDDAEISARRIVEQASGHEGSDLHLGLSDLATVRGVASLDRMVTERIEGRPLQYVVGRWGFRYLDLLVDERVLIPRPETEQVVEIALAEFDRTGGSGSVLDLGTGSGAIGLSLLTERVGATVVMTDVSADALAVARANLIGVGRAAARAAVLEGSWFGPLDDELKGSFSVVVSNPPYVAETDPLPPVVADWEPRGALIPGPTGLEDVARIIADAGEWLTPDGSLVVEMAPTQTIEAEQLARRAGFAKVRTELDLVGRNRMIVAQR